MREWKIDLMKSTAERRPDTRSSSFSAPSLLWIAPSLQPHHHMAFFSFFVRNVSNLFLFPFLPRHLIEGDLLSEGFSPFGAAFHIFYSVLFFLLTEWITIAPYHLSVHFGWGRFMNLLHLGTIGVYSSNKIVPSPFKTVLRLHLADLVDFCCCWGKV